MNTKRVLAAGLATLALCGVASPALADTQAAATPITTTSHSLQHGSNSQAPNQAWPQSKFSITNSTSVPVTITNTHTYQMTVDVQPNTTIEPGQTVDVHYSAALTWHETIDTDDGADLYCSYTDGTGTHNFTIDMHGTSMAPEDPFGAIIMNNPTANVTESISYWTEAALLPANTTIANLQ